MTIELILEPSIQLLRQAYLADLTVVAIKRASGADLSSLSMLIPAMDMVLDLLEVPPPSERYSRRPYYEKFGDMVTPPPIGLNQCFAAARLSAAAEKKLCTQLVLWIAESEAMFRNDFPTMKRMKMKLLARLGGRQVETNFEGIVADILNQTGRSKRRSEAKTLFADYARHSARVEANEPVPETEETGNAKAEEAPDWRDALPRAWPRARPSPLADALRQPLEEAPPEPPDRAFWLQPRHLLPRTLRKRAIAEGNALAEEGPSPSPEEREPDF